MMPKQFAFRIKRQEEALRALHINIAGFRIDRRARSGVAVINRIAEEIIIKLLPDPPSRFGVKTADAFLEV